MKYSIFSAAAILAQSAQAHYFFNKLIINGKETNNDQYVLQNTRTAKYNPTKWENVRDDMTPDLADFRCNKGAFTTQSKTQIAAITAGDKLGFKLAVGATMQHPGPGIVYMSKAPTTVDQYKGDGDWFKVYEESVCNKAGDFTTNAWCTWDKDVIDFTVPKDIPNGDYLVRVEHIGVHGAHVGQAEFYNSCAQVRITGGGNGVPGPTIKFPGGYKKTDSSFNFSIYGGFKEYPMPGPAVWTGGNSGSASTGNSTESAPQTTVSSAKATTSPTKVAAVATTAAASTTAAAAPVATTPCKRSLRKRRHAKALRE